MALFTPYESNYFWELHCAKQDSVGDGTVPDSSGKAPTGTCGGGAKIKQQFRLTGFGHEKAYINPRAQEVTLYAITKITMLAKNPK